MSLDVTIDKDTAVAVVTLDRPDRLNAIDLPMRDEIVAAWRDLRFDDTVRAVVLTGAGERAFCTGLDRDAVVPQPNSPYMTDDPLLRVGPKSNDLWKPVVAAVRGMACGGRLLSARGGGLPDRRPDRRLLRPAHHLRHGQRLRVDAHGAAHAVRGRRADGAHGERGTAVGPAGPRDRARLGSHRSRMARWRPPSTARPYSPGIHAAGVQGTVRALWAAREAALAQAFAQAPHLIALGNLPGERQTELFRSRRREHRLR